MYAGKTPLAQITYRYQGRIYTLSAKLEYYNPSGSIKDRIAQCMLDGAVASGQLKSGQPIVETTSGNTGIAIAAYGAYTHHPVHIFMPDWASVERVKLMELFGATIHLITPAEGGFIGALMQADQFVAASGAYKANQFENPDNLRAHYNGTGVELLQQLPDVSAFVSGVGSGGTLMGIGSRLKDARGARVIAIEPDCAQTIAGKKTTRQHKIEGIGDGFIPKLFQPALLDDLLPVNDDDAVVMASKLARELGMGVGISSGANFIGAALANAQNPHLKIATVFADDNKKYLSTALAQSPKPQKGMVSQQIELLDVVYREKG